MYRAENLLTVHTFPTESVPATVRNGNLRLRAVVSLKMKDEERTIGGVLCKWAEPNQRTKSKECWDETKNYTHLRA